MIYYFLQLRKSECIPDRVVEAESGSGDESLKIRPSKSDTSLTESFVVIGGNGEEVGEVPTPPPRRARQSPHLLRDGKPKIIIEFVLVNIFRYQII